MTLLRTYEDLDAWKAAHEFTLAVYRATEDFPKKEMFGIVAQMRRSAVSIPANLAEGFGRRSDKELLRYCRICDGSLQETKYFLRLSADLGYNDLDRYQTLRRQADRVGALLGGLGRHLSASVRQKAQLRVNRSDDQPADGSTDQRINRSTGAGGAR
ncbi:MAG: four helix bundle protein [Bryobacterales bacterium]